MRVRHMLPGIGNDMFKDWSDEQRRSEIEKLIIGFRSGLDITLVLQPATMIAGNADAAREHLVALISAEDRHAIISAQKGETQTLVASFLI